jgi:hypothetical protein
MSVQEDLDLLTLHEYDEVQPCTSMYCNETLHKPMHPADWAVLLSCGCNTYFCNWRMELYWAEDHVIGTFCDIHDDYHVRLINWIRIGRAS